MGYFVGDALGLPLGLLVEWSMGKAVGDRVVDFAGDGVGDFAGNGVGDVVGNGIGLGVEAGTHMTPGQEVGGLSERSQICLFIQSHDPRTREYTPDVFLCAHPDPNKNIPTLKIRHPLVEVQGDHRSRRNMHISRLPRILNIPSLLSIECGSYALFSTLYLVLNIGSDDGLCIPVV